MSDTHGYVRVLNDLIRRIEAGELKPGAKLPPLHELARQYDVGQMTLRRALWIAEDRGYIQGRRGSGIYVADRNKPGNDPPDQ